MYKNTTQFLLDVLIKTEHNLGNQYKGAGKLKEKTVTDLLELWLFADYKEVDQHEKEIEIPSELYVGSSNYAKQWFGD